MPVLNGFNRFSKRKGKVNEHIDDEAADVQAYCDEPRYTVEFGRSSGADLDDAEAIISLIETRTDHPMGREGSTTPRVWGGARGEPSFCYTVRDGQAVRWDRTGSIGTGTRMYYSPVLNEYATLNQLRHSHTFSLTRPQSASQDW